MFRRLMLATDFSLPAMHAATTAQQLAHAFDSDLALAHVVSTGGLSPSAAAEALGVLRDEHFAGIPAVTPLVIENDRAATGICDAAKERKTSLVVAGRHGEHKLLERLIGTTTERIARHAPCSVYVAEPSQRAQPVTFKHIIAATDLSDNAKPALEAAALLAKRFGAWVTLMHSYDLLPAVELLQEPYHLHDDTSFAGMLNDKLEKLQHEFFDGLPSSVSVVRNKSSVNAICDLASNVGADLVVLGTHGLTGVPRFLLGSVAERVIRHAPCSVLTMR